MCCCGRVIRSQGNPLCLRANRALLAGYVALDAAISTCLFIVTSGKHHSATSRREDGTSKMWILRLRTMLILLRFLLALVFVVGHVQLPDLLCLPCTMPQSGSHIEALPGDDMLCFQSWGKFQALWHFLRLSKLTCLS